MKTLLTIAAALTATTPALAQKKAPPPVAAVPAPAPAATPAPARPPVMFAVTPIPPTDPTRLAAARVLIDKLWPKGSYARLMHVIMGPVMQDSMARTFNMKPGDIIPGLDGGKDAKPGAKPGAKLAESETLGQMAAKGDPYFQQRMALTMNAVGDEMAKVMTELEPDMRDAIAHAYARRFTVAELGELDRFFATPIGRAYAADQYALMMSPDMTVAMQGFIPRLIKEAPEMMARVTAATKDLPPPPGKAKKDAPAPIAPVPPPAKKTP